MADNLDNQTSQEEISGTTDTDTTDTDTNESESNVGSDNGYKSDNKSDRAKERAQRREAKDTESANYKQMLNNLLKEQQNERSLRDRQLNEIRAQQSEWAKHKDMLKEIADLKKKSELEMLKQSNPDEYQKKVMQNLIEENLANQNQNQSENQNQNQNIEYTREQFTQLGNQATQYLIQDPEIGPEKYKTMEPMMMEILKNVPPSDAGKLLQNPNALFDMAVGRSYMSIMKQQNMQQSQNVQKANSFHAGTARPVSTANRAVDYSKMSDKELTALKNEALLKEYNIGR